jgi:hypothetical protein
VNKTPTGDGTTIFTPAWGTTTPSLPNSTEAVLEPFPPTTTGTTLLGTVVQQATGGNTPIPRDGAVLMAHGSQAPKLAAETPPGTDVNVQLVLTPNWPGSGIETALGGGPVIVRNGQPVYAANEGFAPSQLAPRDPRTGVGQRKNGQIVMVAVDGRHPGYSVGMTNFELAQTLVRLGCVTGSAFDSGGSTTMAFDGQLLNRPSDSTGERPISEMLGLEYFGVYSPPPTLPAISPNGDRTAEKETLSYKVVRPSNVTATLTDPTGAAAYTFTGLRPIGTYKVTWPNNASSRRRARGQAALGLWRWVVNATDDQGRASSVQRSFWVNDTLGFLHVTPRSIRLRKHGRNSITARFKLAHAARVTGLIQTRRGVLIRRLGPYRLNAGTRTIRWNGRYRSGGLAYRGGYRFEVFSQNAYGPIDLVQLFTIR